MAVLQQLHIRGIRSFGPEEEAKIKFSTPLTLFLGQNGCGKTTIIESLKFGLTGEVPSGAGHGGGFVNDPLLSNKNSTKGSVKVLFKDAKGEYITVNRAVEVLIKGAAGKPTFKNVLAHVRWENADRSTYQDISSRCADVEAYCAQKLNVSKAILNNVIFCHQENSSWPLEEGKKVKEKFDEIFGATEYNKATERLRKLIKSKQDGIKILTLEYENKKKDKQYADKKLQNLEMIKTKLEEVADQMKLIESQKKPIEERMIEISELEDMLSTLQQELVSKETSLKELRNQENSLKSSINNIFEGADFELDNEIRSFEQTQENMKASISSMEVKQSEIEIKLSETTRDLQRMQIQLGKLTEEENQHQRRVEERKKLIQTVKADLDVVSSSSDDSNILRILKNGLRTTEEQFNKFKEEFNKIESDKQDRIDKVRESLASAKQNVTSNNNLINEYQQKVRELTAKVNMLERTDSQIASIEKTLGSYENSLKLKQQNFDEMKCLQEIDEFKRMINENENMYKQFDKQYQIMQQNYVNTQNIEREQGVVIEKRNEIERIMSKHHDNLRYLFGGNIPESNFERAVREKEITADKNVKNITKKIAENEKYMTSLEATVKHLNEKLKSYKDELRRDQNKVDELCQGNDFDAVLNGAYEKKEKLQRDKGNYRSATVMYEGLIKEFEKSEPCCPICETDFSSKKSVAAAIVKKLKTKVAELPRKLIQTEEELKKQEEFYNKLQQMIQVNENIGILKDDKIPKLDLELTQKNGTLEDISYELVSLQAELQDPQKTVEVSRNLITDASNLDRCSEEIVRSEHNIKQYEKDLLTVDSELSREEMELKLDTSRENLSTMRKELENKKDILDSNKRTIQLLQSNIQNQIQKKLEAQKSAQEKPLLKIQIDESKTKINEYRKERENFNQTVNELDQKLKQLRSEFDEIKRDHAQRIEERRNQLETNKRLVKDIEKLHNDIQIYINDSGREKMEAAKEELKLQHSAIDKLENTRKKLAETISTHKTNLASGDSGLRELLDSKKFRQLQEKVKMLNKELTELRTRIGNQNYKSVFQEKRRLEKQMNDYEAEINSLSGVYKTNEANKKELEAELNQAELKTAAVECLKKEYELKVTQMAVSDLDIYTRALEKSIILFHKERMVHINKTIRELWRNIYQGNDIDYIEIKTDDIVGGAGGKKRSYNYKVVQFKKGIESEMRGRCSAGQRVLASLVIRMALADTFTSTCGILALDEPTTNLDRENINSLCQTLSNMISSRQLQKNFQLLIITHDEEFLQMLTRDQSVSHFWRVRRNRDGFSEIVREPL